MKTQLPKEITTIEQAKDFLTDLYNNNETYHPEDDAHDILWETFNPSYEERDQLNKLMDEIYDLDGNNGDHKNPKFDPCEFLMNLIQDET